MVVSWGRLRSHLNNILKTTQMWSTAKEEDQLMVMKNQLPVRYVKLIIMSVQFVIHKLLSCPTNLVGFHAVWRGEPTTTITNDRNFVFSTVCRCKYSQTWPTFSNWNEHHLTCCHAVFTNKQKATSEGTIARLHIHQHQPTNCKGNAPYYCNQGRKSKVEA